MLLGAHKRTRLPEQPRCTHHLNLYKTSLPRAWKPLVVQSSPDLPAALTRSDAISDLPSAATTATDPQGYEAEAQNQFQKQMRARNPECLLLGHAEPANKQPALFTSKCAADMGEPADTVPCKYSVDWKCFFQEKQRLFTTRESARFQSWPDRHSLGPSACAQQKNVGNMVPPLMAQAIGETIMRELHRFG